MIVRILIEHEDFDVGEEVRRVRESSKKIGGVVSFLGSVRDLSEQADVSGLFLEHYPGMTEKQIGTIIQEAADRWQLMAVTVIHRIGQLAPGEQIVFVCVGGAHRGEAFDACEYIIDFLKTRATFWKKETTTGGDRWLTTRQSDQDSANEWDTP